MKILKFGGSSVGSVKSIQKVAEIVKKSEGNHIVVLSAMYGVTNTLEHIIDLVVKHNIEKASRAILDLKLKYNAVLDELLLDKQRLNKSKQFIDDNYNYLINIIKTTDYVQLENKILAQGEIVSTFIFHKYLEEIGVNSELLSALDFMEIDQFGEPKMETIKNQLANLLIQSGENRIYITQGFICKNEFNKIDNLKRGGSDYTASIIGAALNAEEIQIWTDIDGMHNNDPRYVDDTYSIDEISFEEAAELAYFGAKILHPQSIIPAKEKNIPVLIKNTFSPNSKGTRIHKGAEVKKIRAIAAKDGITVIKIKSYRMLMAYGFLKNIFEVFEKNKTSIDMITTSEVAVSLTIDDTENLGLIINELQGFGKIEVDTDLTIICIAGNLAQHKMGITSLIFNSLKNIPVRMISYGGSNFNLSFLVKTKDKIEVLNLLNEQIFSTRTETNGIIV